MTLLHRVRTFVRWILRRQQVEQTLARDLQDYVERSAVDKMRDGMLAEQAYREARLELGGVEQAKEAVRARLGIVGLESFRRDLRYAVRGMGSRKAFTALAVLCLALGIGANTTIFSLMESTLLRSLPVSDPGSLVALEWTLPTAPDWESTPVSFVTETIDEPPGVRSHALPYGVFELMRSRDDAFSSVVGSGPLDDNLVVVDDGEARASGAYVTGDFFSSLGVIAIAGRSLVEGDDRFGAPAVAMLSAASARERYGSAEGAIGQTVRLNDVPFTVVGVTPPAFFGLDPARSPDYFIPLRASQRLFEPGPLRVGPELFQNSGVYWLTVAARLRPGVDRSQALTMVAPAFEAFLTDSVSGNEQRLRVRPALAIESAAGGLNGLRTRYREPLLVLFAMVAVILVIACANIASLLLSRASARRQEVAVRLSLGAGRLAVIRQLLTESVLLALVGGSAGVLLSMWGTTALTALLAGGSDGFTLRAELNWTVLAFTLLVSLVTGVLFGLAPALHATRVDLFPALKGSRHSGLVASPRWRLLPTFGQALVVAQIALSLVLLVGAGLFAGTLSNLRTTDLGFNEEDLLLADVNTQRAGFAVDQPDGIEAQKAFYARVRERLLQIPGVEEATMSWSVLAGGGAYQLPVSVSGSQIPATDLSLQIVGEGFFRTMEIPILAGRAITDDEVTSRRAVAVIDQRFVDTYFRDIDPLGRTIDVEGEGELEVVGVSAAARHEALKSNARPVVYYSYAWDPHGLPTMVYELRTRGGALDYANAVRRAVRDVNAAVTVTSIRTQEASIDRTINQEIVFARLSNAFAALALLIACVGLYGTIGYAMARRTQEIGIRMALGAQRAGLLALVFRQVIGLAAAGLLLGLPAALLTSRYIEGFLWGVDGRDPATIAGAAAVALAAVALAGYLPASRASRISPLAALRSE